MVRQMFMHSLYPSANTFERWTWLTQTAFNTAGRKSWDWMEALACLISVNWGPCSPWDKTIEHLLTTSGSELSNYIFARLQTKLRLSVVIHKKKYNVMLWNCAVQIKLDWIGLKLWSGELLSRTAINECTELKACVLYGTPRLSRRVWRGRPWQASLQTLLLWQGENNAPLAPVQRK